MKIPESERWLFDNPDALASVERGIDEAAHGLITRKIKGGNMRKRSFWQKVKLFFGIKPKRKRRSKC